MDSKQDIIYYNAIINNTSNTALLDAKYTAKLTQPILNNPSEYFLSIVRFNLPLNSLPIFIWDNSNPTGLYPDGTMYTVGLEYSGTPYTQTLSYIPSTANNTGDPDAYYHVYSYQVFLDMINAAYKLAYAAMAAANPATAGLYAPWWTYDPVTQLMTLHVQKEFETLNIKVAANDPIQLKITIPLKKYEADAIDGMRYQISVKNTGNNFVSSITNPDAVTVPNVYNMVQEYQSLYNWLDLKTIVFESVGIPISYEIYPSQVLNAGVTNTDVSNGQSSYELMLTDLEVLQNNIDVFNNISYASQGLGNHRLINMNSTLPLNTIGFTIKWRNRSGKSHSVILSPKFSCSVKFAFIKKSLYGSRTQY